MKNPELLNEVCTLLTTVPSRDGEEWKMVDLRWVLADPTFTVGLLTFINLDQKNWRERAMLYIANMFSSRNFVTTVNRAEVHIQQFLDSVGKP